MTLLESLAKATMPQRMAQLIQKDDDVNISYEWLTHPEQEEFSRRVKLEVKYSPLLNEVTEIVGCYAINRNNGELIDITPVMLNYFNLDAIVDTIDWLTIYNEKYKD